MPTVEPGKLVTFYSYKGGAGRSMAVANVAWILASNGKRVLIIDWDLEAPGLHRYFAPFLLDRELTATDGLIDFVRRFETAALTTPMPEEGTKPTDESAKPWYEDLADLSRFAVRLDWDFSAAGKSPSPGGRLDFVSAGRQDSLYSERINSFDWKNFYDRLGGGVFLEATKKILRAKYDYILIDSRTGVSDTSGVCTVQLPQILVVFFTANNQSIEGAANVLASVRLRRSQSVRGSEPALRILPMFSRVEPSESDKLLLRRTLVRRRFNPFLDSMRRPDEYWGQVQTLYIPWYAYEEVLAVFHDDNPDDALSLLRPMVNLTNEIAQEVRPLNAQLPSEEQRKKIRDKYADTSAVGRQTDSAGANGRPLQQSVLFTVAGPIGSSRWQERLAKMVQQTNPDAKVDSYRCRFLPSLGMHILFLAFLDFFFRRLLAIPLERAFQRIFKEYPEARLVVVAHGMGAYATVRALERIAESMKKRDTPQIHTLILAGSPELPEFSWDAIRGRGLVARVVNECGIYDDMVVVMSFLGWSFSLSGRTGFSGFYDRRFQNRFHRLGHNGYFQEGLEGQDFMRKYWLPLLDTSESPAPVDDRDKEPRFWTTLLNQRPLVGWLWLVLLVVGLASALWVWQHRGKPSHVPSQAEMKVVGVADTDWFKENQWLDPYIASLSREGDAAKRQDFQIIRISTGNFSSATTPFQLQVELVDPNLDKEYELRGYAFRLRPAATGKPFSQTLPVRYGDKGWPFTVVVPELDKGDSVLILALLMTVRKEGLPPEPRKLLRLEIP